MSTEKQDAQVKQDPAEQPPSPSSLAESDEAPRIDMVMAALEEPPEGSEDGGSTESDKKYISDEDFENLLVRYKADGEEHEATVKEARDQLALAKHNERTMQELGRLANLVPELVERLERLEAGPVRDERGRFVPKTTEAEFDLGEEDEVLTVRSAKQFGNTLISSLDQRIQAAFQQQEEYRTRQERQAHIQHVMTAAGLGPEHVPLAQKRIKQGLAKDWGEAAEQVARMEQAASIDPYDFRNLPPEHQKRMLNGVVPVLREARKQRGAVKRETSPGGPPGGAPHPQFEGEITDPSNVEAVMKACEAIEE